MTIQTKVSVSGGGAAILSFVWFLHRWKTNVLGRAVAVQNLAGINREKLLTVDKSSSVGLFVIGLMALAEVLVCGMFYKLV
ncbi:hypothetical protein V6N11_034629 [Hibiscus sabdariffa]|uniref:Uncharacterized protein n=1 Tax=Hibiscus sabdariffa TaxID=183260 RepID=A0ABR2NDM5_9ROSI